MRRPVLFSILVLVLLVAATFGRVTQGQFLTYDDGTHVTRNTHLTPLTFSNVWYFWNVPWREKQKTVGVEVKAPYEQLYQPIPFTVFAVLANVGQLPKPVRLISGDSSSLNPVAFHTANLVLHIVNTLLVFALLLILLRHPGGAFAGALIFAVHPVQTETVAWIVQLNTLLSTGFSLGCLLCWSLLLRDSVPGAKPVRQALLYTGAIGCLFLAFISKPIAVVVPLFAVVIGLYVYKVGFRRLMVLLWPWFLLAFVITLVNQRLQPPDSELMVPLWRRPFQVGDAFAFYLTKLFFPVFQVADYARRVDLMQRHGWAFATWIFPVVFLVLLWGQRKRWPHVWAGVLMLYLGLLPTSGIVPYYFHGYSTVADRYLYLPIIGVCLAVGALWMTLWQKGKGIRRPLAVATGILAVLWAGRSCIDAGYWHDVESLWTHNLALEPNSWLALNSLAGTYTENGQPDKALPLYRKSIEVNPESSIARFNYGVLLSRAGDNVGALIQLRKAGQLSPDDPDIQNSLAAALAHEGNMAEALACWRRALELNPDHTEALVNFGIALAMTGDNQGAVRSWTHALELDPNNADVRYNLGIALLKQGQPAKAAEQWRLALKANPNHELSRRELQKLGESVSQGGRGPSVAATHP